MGLTEEVKRALESLKITSSGGNNTVENTVISVDVPDLDAAIKDNDDFTKSEKQTQDKIKKIDSWDKGNVGEVQRFTQEQFGNVKGIATDPTQFLFSAFFRKFARGAGVAALALLIFEAVKWIIGELLKPGRFLDRRFKRDINNEIIAFRSREDKQKIRQGLSSVIVTSIGGLRGPAAGPQVSNSLRMIADGADPFPSNFQDALPEKASGLPLSRTKKPGRVFNR